MEQINFNTNWNNKTDCKYFTTLRLSSRFLKGQIYELNVKGGTGGHVEVIDIRMITLAEINDWIAYLDTSYDAEETRGILRTMYKKKNINWETKKISWILLKRVNPNG